MSSLQFKDYHNQVAYLTKSKGGELYYEMIDFLLGSNLNFALTHCPPLVCASLVQQFWATAIVKEVNEEAVAIEATIDGKVYTVDEGLIRSRLQFDDEGGSFLNDSEVIIAGLKEIGYKYDGKNVWKKPLLCPKWRFLVHTLLQCISSKCGGWDQFSSFLAHGIISLAKGEKYNWSKYVFVEMVGNIRETGN